MSIYDSPHNLSPYFGGSWWMTELKAVQIKMSTPPQTFLLVFNFILTIILPYTVKPQYTVWKTDD